MIRLFLVMTALLAQLLAAVGVDDIFQRMMNVPVSALIDVRADGTEKINMGMWATQVPQFTGEFSSWFSERS